MNKKVDIQVKYPKGWKTVCTVESMQEHIFLKFVDKEWPHLDIRVTSKDNEKIVWNKIERN